jgi:hypothetical protein
MELDYNGKLGPPCVLLELLRRMLSLLDYYGPLEANDSDLLELKLALIRTIERLEFRQAAGVAAEGVEPDYAGSTRKGPRGEIMDTTAYEKTTNKKPSFLTTSFFFS